MDLSLTSLMLICPYEEWNMVILNIEDSSDEPDAAVSRELVRSGSFQ